MKNSGIKRLESTLDYLRERLSKNVDRIKANSMLSKEKIAQNPFSDDLDDIRAENKKILVENKDILNLQLLLQNFLTKYDHDSAEQAEEPQIENERSILEWFQLTVNGIVELDEKHPYATNKDFLNDLMSHFQKVEQYEKCKRVLDKINAL